jgi:hypothetical protein
VADVDGRHQVPDVRWVERSTKYAQPLTCTVTGDGAGAVGGQRS